MTIIYLTLKVCVLFATMLFPLLGPNKKHNINSVELSDWAIDEKGRLVNLAEKEPSGHPIRLKH
jgi:hypothetical protein